MQTKWRIKTKLKTQSGGNDWQLREETNLVNGQEAAESRGRGVKGDLHRLRQNSQKNKDSISELLCFF